MAQLRDLDVAAWQTGADEWRARYTNLLSTVTYLHEDLDPRVSAGAWTGPAGDAAIAHLRGVINGLEIDALECQAVSLVLSGLTHAFRISQNSLRSALGAARLDDFPVTGDGLVQLPDTSMARHDPEFAESARVQRDRLQKLVQQAVDAATLADRKAYEMLDHLSQQTFQTDAGAALNEDVGMASKLEVDLIAATVPDGGPDEVAAWWAGLPPEDQQTLRMAVPWALENLPGIPADVRSALHGGGSYDRAAASKWAIDHWNDAEASYDIFENNCTNFVSATLAEAGMKEQGGYWSDDSWWEGPQTGNRWLDLHGGSRSASWAQAFQSYEFWRAHGTEVTAEQAQPGDIIYWETPAADGGPGDVHHSAMVTAVVDGDLRYTQHNIDQVNASLGARAPIGALGGGHDVVHVVRPESDG
ncbi:amidase domain-containing protein [Actinoplanes regularis]|nr:amidase domain-containing protein [Actinoplanes regularis]